MNVFRVDWLSFNGMKNYYTVLGISRDADAAAVKAAFRRLSKKYHPDSHSGDGRWEEEFKAVNEAYGVLEDEGRRREYDLRLAAWEVGEQVVYIPAPSVRKLHVRYLVAAVLLVIIVIMLILKK